MSGFVVILALLSALAFGLLALTAELVGRSLTHRLDFGRHVATPELRAAPTYYPFLLARVKVGVALLLARSRGASSARSAAARAAKRLLGASARGPVRACRGCGCRSRRGSGCSRSRLTSLLYLVQTDAERVAVGRWPLLAPWLHTSALPVFAVLAVVVALCWGAVARWLADYERYAEAAVARASRLALARRAARAGRPGRRRAGRSAPPLRARLRVAPASPPRVTRGEALAGSRVVRGFEPWEERWNRTLQATRPSGVARRSRRVRRSWLLGPLTVVGRRRLGDPPAVPDHAAAPARAGLLVAVRRAAALVVARRARSSRSSSRRACSPTSRTRAED